MLDVNFLRTVTRKGESRLGDNTVLNKGLDLRDKVSKESKISADSGVEIDQLAVLSIFACRDLRIARNSEDVDDSHHGKTVCSVSTHLFAI